MKYNVDEALIYALLSEYKGMQSYHPEEHHSKKDPKLSKSTQTKVKQKAKVAMGLGNMDKN